MKAAEEQKQSSVSLKAGFLQKKQSFGLGLQWKQRWFELTPTEIIYQDLETKKKSRIAVKDITSVRAVNDVVRSNVFEIHTGIEGGKPYRLAAPTPAGQKEWIQKISAATGIDAGHLETIPSQASSGSTAASFVPDSIELVRCETGTEVRHT